MASYFNSVRAAAGDLPGVGSTLKSLIPKQGDISAAPQQAQQNAFNLSQVLAGQRAGSPSGQIEYGGAVGVGYGPASGLPGPAGVPTGGPAGPGAVATSALNAQPPSATPVGGVTAGGPTGVGGTPTAVNPGAWNQKGGIQTPPASRAQANLAQPFAGTATGVSHAAAGGPTPVPAGAPGGADFIDASRRLEFQNLTDLQNAAQGNVPSAAEIQGRNMAARAGAQQYGLAAALQGGHTPAEAMRRAQLGAAGVAAQAREDAGAQRAAEQATARQQLTTSLSGIRGQEQDLSTAQANLNQQQQNALLQAQLQAMGYSVQAAAAIADAQAKQNSANMQFGGSILQGISDERAKTDIKPAHLESLADALEGFTYRYKDPSEPGAGPGQRVGIMAQDALKGGPLGRDMVVKRPDGRLALDFGNSVGAALAMGAAALRKVRDR